MDALNSNSANQMTTIVRQRNYRKYLFLLLSHWYWFAIAIVLTSIGTWLYYRYAHPTYAVSATMLIHEQQNQSPLTTPTDSEANVFQGFGLFQGTQNTENQIQILKSWTQIRKTLEHFNFEVSYLQLGRFRTSELYRNLPFHVEWDRNHPQLLDANFDLHILPDNRIEMTVRGKEAIRYDFQNEKELKPAREIEQTRTFPVNSYVASDDYAFRIIPAADTQLEGSYRIAFHSLDQLTNEYMEKLTVAPVSKEGTMIKLSTTCENPEKGIDFLNKMMQVYQTRNLDKKNVIATKTIFFITSQLASVSDSLSASQKVRERFQSHNNLLDVSYQSQQLLDQLVKLEDQKSLLETQHQYYQYLEEYLSKNEDLESLVAPTTVGINDPLLVNLLQELSQLNIELTTLSATVKDPEHPRMRQLSIQMETTKRTLLENSRNIMRQSEITLNDLTKRIDELKRRTSRLPSVERNYVNIERRYQLNNDTYTFLLQKLSEAQIAKASNMPDNEIVDPARMEGDKPISPNQMTVYLVALLLGIFLPAGGIILTNEFDNKVRTPEDLGNLTKYPVLGHIIHDDQATPNHTALLDHPNSPIGETYRALRMKLKFMLNGNDHPVIAVTSTGADEGKTFTAMNLAASFALLGQKTILLDLDLRNSKMAEMLNCDKNHGISNYLLGEMRPDNIIFKSSHPYMRIIPSGTFPPNPGELLADKKLAELIELLKEKYDVIIIDSSPLLVADLFQYSHLCNAYLYVTRQGVTLQPALKSALEEISNQHIRSVGLLLNDIRINRQPLGHRYNYSYMYGYSYKPKNNRNRPAANGRKINSKKQTQIT
ncbi:tyrosine protein kinase [Prolixibacter bellariivorans]|uniref:non-specific protein-tyrosine kinase n=1 Tax=Prolixibacter bellariivorans TaxID=314319 RepID=A0A5M4B212_9BACT|nr:tyrosine-protein kinase [Prolixibacter bellariivorans]GET34210.1 tyrosine protein kinase [Prolixibacter bellariivorans]